MFVNVKTSDRVLPLKRGRAVTDTFGSLPTFEDLRNDTRCPVNCGTQGICQRFIGNKRGNPFSIEFINDTLGCMSSLHFHRTSFHSPNDTDPIFEELNSLVNC